MPLACNKHGRNAEPVHFGSKLEMLGLGKCGWQSANGKGGRKQMQWERRQTRTENR